MRRRRDGVRAAPTVFALVALVGLLVASPIARQGHSATAGVPLEVQIVSLDGTMSGGSLEPLPGKPENPERVKAGFVSLVRRHDVKAPDGRAITGIGFNSWTENGTFQVVVFELVASATMPNVYAPERIGMLTQRKFDTFSLPAQVRARHVVAKMKDLGLTPLTVVVGHRGVPESAR